MRRITVSKTRPDHWPTGDQEESWEDAWGKHTLKKGVLTTEYVGPRPASMQLKRKYRGSR